MLLIPAKLDFIMLKLVFFIHLLFSKLFIIVIGVAKPGHTRAAARASPIFAPASASYLDF